MALCLTEAGQIDKAKVILNRLNTDFPEGAKTCITLFKLAGIAASENDIASQKQYLQTLLEKKQCMETNEFLQGAEMLEEILNAETTTPVPVDSLVAKDSTAKAAEVKTADSLATPATVSEEKPAETQSVAETKTEEPAKETPVNTEAVKEEKK
jgi:hypothetical protein